VVAVDISFFQPAGHGPVNGRLLIETPTAKEARKGIFCRGKLLGCPDFQGGPEIKVWTKW